jgi:hypothetical protein
MQSFISLSLCFLLTDRRPLSEKHEKHSSHQFSQDDSAEATQKQLKQLAAERNRLLEQLAFLDNLIGELVSAVQ